MNSWQMVSEEALSAIDKGRLPGAQLKAAREAKGLALEEVAEALHLHKRQIVALEDDDYGQFSAPIFVIGYLRNYARLLDLDPEPLLSGLGEHAPKTPEVRPELTIPIKRRWLPSEAWGPVALIAAVLLLLAIWALSRPPSVDTPVGSSAPSAVPFEESKASASEAAQAATAEEAETQEVSKPVVDREPDKVVLKFTGDSWVEVTDANGRRLTARMGKQGDEWELQGQPLDVLLGNATNVGVEYNGQPYTKISPSRQNVASFKLGQPPND